MRCSSEQTRSFCRLCRTVGTFDPSAVLGCSGACFGGLLSLFSLKVPDISTASLHLAWFYPSSPLHVVVLCLVLYQIEMAIETLQKSEGLSSQRSSLLNSHVSCFPNACFSRPRPPARLWSGSGCSPLWLLVVIVSVSPAFTGCCRTALAEA